MVGPPPVEGEVLGVPVKPTHPAWLMMLNRAGTKTRNHMLRAGETEEDSRRAAAEEYGLLLPLFIIKFDCLMIFR